jgi:hypothetical protein
MMLPPPRLPPVEGELVVGMTVGVVAVGVWTGALGSPGLNGFEVAVFCAAAAAGRTSATATGADMRNARSRTGGA